MLDIQEDHDSEYDNSKITLFTNEYGEANTSRLQDIEIISKDKNALATVSESNYESNNFNYSESQYPHQNLNSIGAITQGGGCSSQIF